MRNAVLKIKASCMEALCKQSPQLLDLLRMNVTK